MSLSGQIFGTDGKVQIAHGFGKPNHNVTASAFAAGSIKGGPVTTGGALAYNKNGHGLALSKVHVPGGDDSFTQSANANIFNNGTHKFDVNAFTSQNKSANGFEYKRHGAGMEWSHVNGHSANASISKIQNLGTQAQLGASANLWKSQAGNTSLNLNGGASKWMSGPFKGQSDFGGGVGIHYKF